MISVDFINIDNAKLVGRLLPFWARGRFVQRLMVSILHPLTTIHQKFREWVQEFYIECHITFQRESIEWYFKHKLGHRLQNPDDGFIVIQGVDEDYCCFSLGYWSNKLDWDNQLLWANEGDEFWKTYDFVPDDDSIYVLAPDLKDDPGYTMEDYERDIRHILSMYRIGFTKIKIYTPQTLTDE